MAARSTSRRAKPVATNDARPPPAARPRVVYTEAPLRLATPLEPAGDRWRLRVGATELEAPLHPSVDPALVAEVAARGGRVMVEHQPDPLVVGVLQTSRTLTVDARGDVKARVRRLEVNATESVLLRTPGSFAKISAKEIELYSVRVLTRARELAKILAAMIKLN